MKLSDFDFCLPPELIAQEPAERREDSRLMVLNRENRTIDHLKFHQVPDLMHAGDLLVLNNTRVVPSRLFGKRHTGGRVEALLVEEIETGIWQALLKSRGRLEDGEAIEFTDELQARLLGKHPAEGWLLDFKIPAPAFLSMLEKHGLMPLPPYIKREKGSDARNQMDMERYQTVFARESGAIAAPTAGLHFTDKLIENLKARGVLVEYVTLHVGLGTFKPVTAEDVQDHVMHPEEYFLSEATAKAVNDAKAEGRRVIPVGTTSLRTLESCAAGQRVSAGQGDTNLFIYPPYDFQIADAMITNFHLPKSTLMMLISALADRALVLDAYRIAIEEKYRFFSYGDAMFIL
ncbi:MAG: tRNA preQ1(34) S-adenosylmethionine ribosyltransferase-isomerase QueA [Planctomycetota bacterium]|nr:tRNA preQ1(34) S-adenosylmethionine ribosyltransferase-isomerase QueA [Planctomycetota bacterium]MDA1140931.1 tRNA preQ1(34) S-adenosylmethionine ribosyltransferase-isomerase QueA [Planctomycetota bacterium]